MEPVTERRPSAISRCLKGVQVLLIDSDLDTQLIVHHFLSFSGADVEVIKGVQWIPSVFNWKRFDAILLGVGSKADDSTALLAKVRNKGYFGPIVAMVDRRSVRSEKLREDLYNEVIEKPIESRLLVTRVESLCDKSRLGSQPLISHFANDPRVAPLLPIFTKKLPLRYAAIQESFERENLSEVGKLAHQLKGAAGGYGFPEISRCAGELESRCLGGGDRTGVELVLRQLKALIARASSFSVRSVHP